MRLKLGPLWAAAIAIGMLVSGLFTVGDIRPAQEKTPGRALMLIVVILATYGFGYLAGRLDGDS
jgi:hypothetical protein